MTYTQLSLPHQKKFSFHAFFMGAFVVITGVYVAGMLGITYFSLENQNAELTAKLNGLSKTATNVSAPIVTPAGASQQTSLTPVDKSEVIELLDKVNTLAILPGEESPTLATVVDIAQLEKDTFFRNGLNGDKLFVYQTAGIVLLYRPSEGKIVNMGNINGATGMVQGVSQKRASSEASLKKVRVGVYYVSDNTQRQDTLVKSLTALADVEIAEQTYAKNVDYKETLVIGLTELGKGPMFKEVLKAANGIETLKIPDGEDISGVDIAIILGE